MAGSPIKRARKKARLAAEASAELPPVAACPAPPLPQPISGEILPPALIEDAADPTRTQLKRAMRRRAEELADEAMERLAQAMRNPDDRIGAPAAREILDRAVGKPTQELEVGAGGVAVTIVRFGD